VSFRTGRPLRLPPAAGAPERDPEQRRPARASCPSCHGKTKPKE